MENKEEKTTRFVPSGFCVKEGNVELTWHEQDGICVNVNDTRNNLFIFIQDSNMDLHAEQIKIYDKTFVKTSCYCNTDTDEGVSKLFATADAKLAAIWDRYELKSLITQFYENNNLPFCSITESIKEI